MPAPPNPYGRAYTHRRVVEIGARMDRGDDVVMNSHVLEGPHVEGAMATLGMIGKIVGGIVKSTETVSDRQERMHLEFERQKREIGRLRAETR